VVGNKKKPHTWKRHFLLELSKKEAIQFGLFEQTKKPGVKQPENVSL